MTLLCTSNFYYSCDRIRRFDSLNQNANVTQIMLSTLLNPFIRKNIKIMELIGVVMRIASFSLVSWLGPHSPFMFVWIVNTSDAILLTWCALLKRDFAYTLFNAFWILIGGVGFVRAAGFFH
jgi:hypothetical protein